MSIWRRIGSCLAAFLVLVLVTSNLVQAQETSGGSGLAISPTRVELTIEAGKEATFNVSLRNVTGVDTTARAAVNDFESDNQTGEPRIIVDPNQKLSTSIKDFVVNATNVELKKDEKKDVKINVAIPKDTAPGAYYGILRYTALPANVSSPDEGQVALNASVGTLVLITVPGEISQQIQINKVAAERNSKASTLFTSGAPDKVAITIKNAGNGFSKPLGKVVVTNMKGKEVYSYNFNTIDGNILPNATRVFKDELKNVSSPGRYTISASISPSSGREVITVATSFWVIPTWFLVFLGVLIGILGLSIVLIYRKVMNRRPSKRRH